MTHLTITLCMYACPAILCNNTALMDKREFQMCQCVHRSSCKYHFNHWFCCYVLLFKWNYETSPFFHLLDQKSLTCACSAFITFSRMWLEVNCSIVPWSAPALKHLHLLYLFLFLSLFSCVSPSSVSFMLIVVILRYTVRHLTGWIWIISRSLHHASIHHTHTFSHCGGGNLPL